VGKDDSQIKVASFARIRRFAQILELKKLISILQNVRLKFGSVSIYGISSDGRVVAASGQTILFVDDGLTGIPAQDRKILSAVSSEFRSVVKDLDQILQSLNEPTQKKQLRFFHMLKSEGSNFLFDTPVNRVASSMEKHPSTGRSTTNNKTQSVTAWRDWWNDPDRRHWE